MIWACTQATSWLVAVPPCKCGNESWNNLEVTGPSVLLRLWSQRQAEPRGDISLSSAMHRAGLTGSGACLAGFRHGWGTYAVVCTPLCWYASYLLRIHNRALQFSAPRLNRDRSWHRQSKQTKSRGTESELAPHRVCSKVREANAMTNYQVGKRA